MRYITQSPPAGRVSSRPRRIAVLGSTGSIGRSGLDVMRRQKDFFQVTALAGGKNISLLAEQAAEFRPACLAVFGPQLVDPLRGMLPSGYAPEIVSGPAGYETAATLPETDFVLSAQVGAAGLGATAAAAAAGKVIALANKESLVLAGHLIRDLCEQSGASILPVDSEHNAIFQCMAGHSGADVTRILLTASGGPFRGRTRAELQEVTLEQALNHPNWSMGAKITIDSSTLMNKGLEVIEACHLYGLSPAEVDVVVHKESIVHSLVEFGDGSQLAQLGLPDMRMAIAYCLGWPERLHTGAGFLDLVKIGRLTFEAPDEVAFPCLGLARQAYSEGGGCTVVLNAANETAVEAFLKRRIRYLDIPDTVSRALDHYLSREHTGNEPADISSILDLDLRARQFSEEIIRQMRP